MLTILTLSVVLIAFFTSISARALREDVELPVDVSNAISIIERLLHSLGPETVPELDLNSYSGRWYQTHASLIPNITFEADGYCVTADYAVVDEVTMSVTNTMTVGSIEGEFHTINGTAQIKDPEYPGRLKLKFNDGHGGILSNFRGFYWVIAVGPIMGETMAKYEWAVVSVPLKLQLYILARDVAKFKAEYETEVLNLVDSLGFNTFINKPLSTYQGADCAYMTL
eukprot:CAMPEP_0182422918 /NCGR_PEP_ID=MMETSP1167-20130531/8769_1 /TAXON_ID=2988 /ORGANISM="Mallomonas Sp, Strain CCMP3275" /LENGTH=225 /DNA_ID=CAMNT_0024601403 /DNA_START=387 /DNA_END=1064 /DNA_ORIENTATION=+